LADFFIGADLSKESFMSELHGGCLCGNVRYRVMSPPKSISVCHCRNCRKQSGSHRSLNWLIPEDALIIEGDLTTFRDTGDSGKTVLRQFCGKCGSPIRTLAELLPGLAVLKAGTLDLTPEQAPNYALYSVNAAPWELNGLDCPKFDGMPVAPKST
jgi:hypothetical protein